LNQTELTLLLAVLIIGVPIFFSVKRKLEKRELDKWWEEEGEKQWEKEQEEKEQERLREEARVEAQRKAEEERRARIPGHGESIDKFFFLDRIHVKPESIRYECRGTRSDSDSVFDLTTQNRNINIRGVWAPKNRDPNGFPETNDPEDWAVAYITFETRPVADSTNENIHIFKPPTYNIYCSIAISDSLMDQLETFLSRQGDQSWVLELNLCTEFRVFTPSGYFGKVLEYRLLDYE
jgi:hypothetical protein